MSVKYSRYLILNIDWTMKQHAGDLYVAVLSAAEKMMVAPQIKSITTSCVICMCDCVTYVVLFIMVCPTLTTCMEENVLFCICTGFVAQSAMLLLTSCPSIDFFAKTQNC